MTTDPLIHFLQHHPFTPDAIEAIDDGKMYLGILLKDGRYGVCAKLRESFNAHELNMNQPDIANIHHRIFLVAYYNACFNTEKLPAGKDIFASFDFSVYKNITMIGYFVSLVKKFQEQQIPLKIHDLYHEGPEVREAELKDEDLNTADAVILTSTSLFNNTFTSLYEQVHPDADIFLLGPSTILSQELFQLSKIKTLCGTIFANNITELRQRIQLGNGYQEFGKLGRKTCI